MIKEEKLIFIHDKQNRIIYQNNSGDINIVTNSHLAPSVS